MNITYNIVLLYYLVEVIYEENTTDTCHYNQPYYPLLFCRTWLKNRQAAYAGRYT